MQYLMSTSQINEGISRCKNRIQNLLFDADAICNTRNTATIAVGLYTIAIEEGGKLLLLQDSLSSTPNSDGRFNVSSEMLEQFHTKITQILQLHLTSS